MKKMEISERGNLALCVLAGKVEAYCADADVQALGGGVWCAGVSA